jgi:hypothetical protein
MQRFQMKEPITIDAMQWFDTDECREKFAAWFAEVGAEFSTRGPVVDLENGDAFPRDWIALHADGEFYVYQPDRFEKKFEEIKDASNSKLVAHAEFELKRAGLFERDADYGGALGDAALALVRLFASQNHSGMSAAMTRTIFNGLANYKVLTPITADPAEWRDVTEHMGKPTHQNTRQSSCFSRDGGKTYIDVDEPVADGMDRTIMHSAEAK